MQLMESGKGGEERMMEVRERTDILLRPFPTKLGGQKVVVFLSTLVSLQLLQLP